MKNLIVIQSVMNIIPRKNSFRMTSIIFLSLCISCIGFEFNMDEIEPIEFEFSANLEIDDDGYYHLPLDLTSLYTPHKVTGRVHRNGRAVNAINFAWASNSNIVGSNYSSYSDVDGYTSAWLYPDSTMKGSYATVYYSYYDNWRYETTTGEFHIVFD